MTKIGYARVSTSEQEINLQLDALKAEGCLEKNIFIDKVSGSKKERLGLTKALSILKAGDTLVVWRLDRLGRSMSHLVSLMEELRQNKIFFKSINRLLGNKNKFSKIQYVFILISILTLRLIWDPGISNV